MNALGVFTEVDMVPLCQAVHEHTTAQQASEAEELCCLWVRWTHAQCCTTRRKLIVGSDAAIDERLQHLISKLVVPPLAPLEVPRAGG